MNLLLSACVVLLLTALRAYRSERFNVSRRTSKLANRLGESKREAARLLTLSERQAVYIGSALRELEASRRITESGFFNDERGRIIMGLAADLEAARKEIAMLRSANLATLPPESRPPR